MIHATKKTLDQIKSLLDEIRAIEKIKEKSNGVFYFKSQAFLHFHEDPEGIFADLRAGISNGDKEWIRLCVNSEAERKMLVKRVIQAVR